MILHDFMISNHGVQPLDPDISLGTAICDDAQHLTPPVAPGAVELHGAPDSAGLRVDEPPDREPTMAAGCQCLKRI